MASTASASDQKSVETLHQELPGGIKRQYFQLEFVRQNPIDRTAETLKPGKPTLVYGYHYNLHNEWLMGLTFSFRSFIEKETEKEIALGTLGHESLRIVRVYDSIYFLVGPKFSYLVPTDHMQIPFQKLNDYVFEIGVGLVASVAYVCSPNWYIAVRTERWRGTATSKFQGYEHGISVNINLD